MGTHLHDDLYDIREVVNRGFGGIPSNVTTKMMNIDVGLRRVVSDSEHLVDLLSATTPRGVYRSMHELLGAMNHVHGEYCKLYGEDVVSYVTSRPHNQPLAELQRLYGECRREDVRQSQWKGFDHDVVDRLLGKFRVLYNKWVCSVQRDVATSRKMLA